MLKTARVDCPRVTSRANSADNNCPRMQTNMLGFFDIQPFVDRFESEWGFQVARFPMLFFARGDHNTFGSQGERIGHESQDHK